MQQIDLFTYAAQNPRPMFRAVDSSAQAAKKIEKQAHLLREKVLVYVKEQGELGATPDETSIGLNIDILNIRPRFTELKDAGLIRGTAFRRTNRKGNTTKVWVIT